MTPPPASDPAARTTAAYRQGLLLSLRLRDVPGPRIGEVLAEVDSHVAETGQDPREAFGPAKDYAREVAVALDPRRGGRVLRSFGLSDVGVAVTALAGGLLLANGVYGVSAGAPALGLPGPVALLLGLALLAVTALLVRRAGRAQDDQVRDPRTGGDMVGPAPWWATAVGIGVPLLALVGLLVLGLSER